MAMYIWEGSAVPIAAKGYKGQWYVGTGPLENVKSVMTFQADGDELALILDAMKGFRKDIRKAHEELSEHLSKARVSLGRARGECYKLRSYGLLSASYTELNNLASEWGNKDLKNMSMEEIAFFFKDNKINFIREVRLRFPGMSLITAKRMQEGFWAANGW